MKSFVRRSLDAFSDWSDGPWRSKSVLAAVLAVVVGSGFWFLGLKSSPAQKGTGRGVTNAAVATLPTAAAAPAVSHWDWSRPFPSYVPMGASYVAGFCIGWLFRKLMRMVAVVGVLLLGLLSLGRFAGCSTTWTQEQVKHSREWTQHELTSTRDYLKSSLPWTATGGVGAFLGFRRRRKSAPPTEPAAD